MCLYPTLPRPPHSQAYIDGPLYYPPRRRVHRQAPGGVSNLETRNLCIVLKKLGTNRIFIPIPHPSSFILHPCAAIILLKSRSSTSIIDHISLSNISTAAGPNPVESVFVLYLDPPPEFVARLLFSSKITINGENTTIHLSWRRWVHQNVNLFNMVWAWQQSTRFVEKWYRTPAAAERIHAHYSTSPLC